MIITAAADQWQDFCDIHGTEASETFSQQIDEFLDRNPVYNTETWQQFRYCFLESFLDHFGDIVHPQHSKVCPLSTMMPLPQESHSNGVLSPATGQSSSQSLSGVLLSSSD